MNEKVISTICGDRIGGCKYEDMCAHCTAPDEIKAKCKDKIEIKR